VVFKGANMKSVSVELDNGELETIKRALSNLIDRINKSFSTSNSPAAGTEELFDKVVNAQKQTSPFEEALTLPRY
jgi:uncharacterized protein with ATP-grasp and redox domains